ncbi:MAG: MotA/TolQ/ExbB proton channel family protein [Candidatus Marinimicrobia bacterium]|nr:MotA/TolQ/ExbB proton channel family protein [Candidatus Neomarinimicrobiota bacterium]
MDIATILGIVSGLTLVAMAILGNGEITTFIDVPSLMIVVGGTGAAIFVNFAMKEVFSVMTVVKKVFTDDVSSGIDTIEIFEELAKRSRREGILAIDKYLSKVEDDYMKAGLEMAVDGTEPETIREVMESELTYLMERHKKGQQIFNALGMYAPAFGMIGTLIGLINMLKGLEDPTSIGEGMSVALITTFYGAFLANLLFLPIAGKLKIRSDQEVIHKELVIEGVLAIQMGEHPKNLVRKLLNFLPPKVRRQYLMEDKAGEQEE